MPMSDVQLASLALRLDYLEKERVARLEALSAAKADVDRERDSRIAADLRLEDAIKEMKDDIKVIRSNTTWALRTVAGSLFTAVLAIALTFASRGVL